MLTGTNRLASPDSGIWAAWGSRRMAASPVNGTAGDFPVLEPGINAGPRRFAKSLVNEAARSHRPNRFCHRLPALLHDKMDS